MQKINLGIAASLQSRREIAEIFIVAALFGLGINLLSSYISDSTTVGWMKIAEIGFLVIVPTIYLVGSIWKNRKASTEVELVVLLHREKNSVLAIPRYKFSESLAKVTDAVFLENSALKKQWDNEPLGSVREPKDVPPDAQNQNLDRKVKYISIVRVPDNKVGKAKKKSEVLLCEAIEFVIIEELSMHLSSYFKRYSDDDAQIAEVTRKDISKALLENRFLEMLTKDWVDRPIFTESGISYPTEGTLCAIHGSDGSMFSRFDLMLPVDTRISRPSPGKLKLENGRFCLDISVVFDGYSAVFPRGFAHAYLGERTTNIASYKVNVSVDFRLKLLGLVSLSGWEYYHWVDSFFDRINNNLNFEHFVNKISWDSTATLIHTNQILARLRQAARPEAGGVDKQVLPEAVTVEPSATTETTGN